MDIAVALCATILAIGVFICVINPLFTLMLYILFCISHHHKFTWHEYIRNL